jgi:YfiH family protein
MPVQPHAAAAGGVLTPPALKSEALAGLAHGFFGRKGGVSTGVHASLNAGPGSNDNPAAVAENRARIAAAIGVAPARLVSVHQVHSPNVARIDAPFAGERPKADALVTRAPGLGLAILTADCAPVLFADIDAGVIGAAHAGWRGALAGVLETTVRAMREVGARRIAAAVGPTIALESYEIGPDFEAGFREGDPKSAAFFGTVRGRRSFDLPGYCIARLARLDLERIDALLFDTYARDEDWFSARRALHSGDGDYGRNCAAIALPG